jgi:hypothetical protein
MKISIENPGNLLSLMPETEAEIYQLEHLSKSLKKEKIKHKEGRQWVIEFISIPLTKDKAHD